MRHFLRPRQKNLGGRKARRLSKSAREHIAGCKSKSSRVSKDEVITAVGVNCFVTGVALAEVEFTRASYGRSASSALFSGAPKVIIPDTRGLGRRGKRFPSLTLGPGLC